MKLQNKFLSLMSCQITQLQRNDSWINYPCRSLQCSVSPLCNKHNILSLPTHHIQEKVIFSLLSWYSNRLWDWMAEARFLSSPQCQDQLVGSTQPPIQCPPEAILLGEKLPGHEADHSPLSSAEVKNGGIMLN
jgi:hypothetical protein